MNEIHLSLVKCTHIVGCFVPRYFLNNMNMLCMVLKTEIKFWHSLSFQEIFLWQIYIKNKPNGAKTEIWFDTICWYMYHQFHRNAILYQKRFPQVYFIVSYTKSYKLCISTYFDTALYCIIIFGTYKD